MRLPILHVAPAPTAEMLIRYFHQAQSRWTAHLSECTELDFGSAWTNAQLSRVQMANRIMDVALPAGITPTQAMHEVQDHFASHGVQCLQWVMNPSSPADQTVPLAELLQSQGFETRITDIMHLEHAAASPPRGSSDPLTIIPARASFRHVRMLHEESLRDRNEPQLLEARMMHLDDPHCDSLLALKDGQPAGHVAVFAMGEIGLIAQLYVAGAYRRRGIGATMMRRALEICARSLFKHVLLDVWPSDTHVIRMYEQFGFRKIGPFVAYQRP